VVGFYAFTLHLYTLHLLVHICFLYHRLAFGLIFGFFFTAETMNSSGTGLGLAGLGREKIKKIVSAYFINPTLVLKSMTC
jgi:hypothetical protein